MRLVPFIYAILNIVETVVGQEVCADPVLASAEYLRGKVIHEGPCKTETASDRFERYREWINSIGGWVNPKIHFRRGAYIDDVTGEAKYSVGGVFLKKGEEISQGEVLIEVPESAHFCDKLIQDHIPEFKRFMFKDMTRLWLSMGLAALIKYHPRALGPWAAVLPDISYHPSLWDPETKRSLHGTHAFSLLMWVDYLISSGCETHRKDLEALAITCEEVRRAHALILSRSFGMSMHAGDSAVTIPLGFDFLNHSPNTKSAITRINEENRSLFQMFGFTLPESRELFNNYGVHSMSLNLILYGFLSPDSKDELVILATTDGIFDGKIFPPVDGEFCPVNQESERNPFDPLDDIWSFRTCVQSVANRIEKRRWDEYGNFRLSNQDIVAMAFRGEEIGCSTVQEGPLWKHLEKLVPNPNKESGGYAEYVLPLGGSSVSGESRGPPPFIGVGPTTNYLAACALPHLVHGEALKRFEFDLTTCSNLGGKDEWATSPGIQHLAWTSMLKVCRHHEFNVLGGLEEHLTKWIAARNVRILNTSKSANQIFIAEELMEYEDNDQFYKLLNLINDNKNTVFTDHGNLIDTYTEQLISHSHPLSTIIRQEEIHKYLMQNLYLLEQKCRIPLESLMSIPNFTSTITSYIYN